MGEAMTDRRFKHAFGWQRGRCYLCGKPMKINPLKTRLPGRLDATTDHIKPLHIGGKRARENTALAHYTCNSVRGADVPTACQILFGEFLWAAWVDFSAFDIAITRARDPDWYVQFVMGGCCDYTQTN